MRHETEPNPPRTAAWLIKRIFMDGGGCSILGDITESYCQIVEENGAFAARVWFWCQCGKALPAFLRDYFYWRTLMLKNYFVTALRNLRKNRLYSFLNISGLAAGLATFILIALFVQYEWSFDRYHENADRIFRIVRDKPSGIPSEYLKTAVTPAPLGPALMQEFPEISAAARIIKTQDVLISNEKENFLEEELYWADPASLKIFSLPLKTGDAETALTDPDSILLSEKTALKYFGEKDPVGSILTLSEQNDFKVTGVFFDMPDNSHFVMDVIVPYETYFQLTRNNITSWNSNFSYTYFLLRKDADSEELAGKLPAFIDKYAYQNQKIPDRFKNVLRLQALTDIHLHSHRNQELSANSDIIYVVLFLSVAILILVIACFNYINLTTARSFQRGKEVGIRKVVGANKGQLIKQYLGESLALTVLAMILAIAFVLAVLPSFSGLLERPLRFNPIDNPQLLLGLISIIILVGLSAGAYPALSISSFKPVSSLKGAFVKSSKGLTLRNILVLAQFSITITAVIFTFVVRDQLNFIKNRNLGYAREQIMTLRVRDNNITQNLQAVKSELLQYPGVTTVSASENLPNNIDFHTGARWTGQESGSSFPIYYNTADYDYVDLFDIEIVSGRNFSREFPSDQKGAFLVNEAAVASAQWQNPIGQELVHWGGNKGKIVGVMKNFHMHSLHRPIDPLYIFLDGRGLSFLSIKIKPSNIPATIEHVKAVMKKFSPNYPFEFTFFDEIFERTYQTEQHIGGVFRSFAILAIFIACLGLFGLSTFAAAQRTKEIGIRKVMGAPASEIIMLFSKDFLRWVLIANILAWPAAYFAMNKWLQNFAFRTSINPAVFVISGLAAVVIAALAVSFQSIKAARTDPVMSLRHE